jgi:hypothetical protein
MGSLGAQEWQLYPGIIAVFLFIYWWMTVWKASRAEEGTLIRPKKKWAFILWDAGNLLWLGFILWIGISGGRRISFAGVSLSVRSLKNPVIIFLVSILLRIVLDRRLRSCLKAAARSTDLSQKFYFCLILAAWLFSFGPVIRCLGREIMAGPYSLLYKWIPGFQGLRVPSRFVVLMMLGLSVLAGQGTALFLERWKSRRTKILVLAVLGVLVLIDYASIPIPLVPVVSGSRIPAVYSAVKNLPKDAVLIELPMPEHDRDEFHEAGAVYYSMFHKKKIVNGYSGYAPPGYRVVREAMEFFPSYQTLGLLRNLGVDYILLHTGGYRARKGRMMYNQLRRFQDEMMIVEQTQGDYLFRLNPGEVSPKEAEVLGVVGDREKWTATASLNKEKVGLAFDGDMETGWSTGYPQRRGDFFWLDFGSSVRMRKVELYLNHNPLDFPRSYMVEGSADGVTWVRLSENSRFFPELDRSMIEDFSKYIVNISFEPVEIRYLKITLTRSHEERHWSINEIVCKN